MASLDVIALDPTVPQLRAPGVGDTYHFCRVVEFQDGTDAAPSITNVGDTNTGIYWPNADELAVSTGGVQRMSLGATTVFNETGADVDFRIEGDTDANLVFVDASTDRVGLGLNNPDRLLDVDGSSKFRGQILITSGEALGLGLQALQLPTGVESTIGAGLSTRTGVAGESIIQFGNNMNTYYTGSVNAAKPGAMIRIDTRGVEPTPGASAYSVFQIQTRAAGVADPNYTVPVQIGAAPQGTFCIQTNGLATFNYGFVVNEGGGDYDTRFEGDTDTHLFFADASTDRIGIGTASPAGKLHVAGQARIQDSASASNYILIGSGANASRGGNSVMAQTGSMVMGTEAASNLIFITNAAESARFDSSGNLGIGTSSPLYRLDVRGAGAVISVGDTGTSGATLFGQVNSGNNGVGAIQFFNGGDMGFDTGATGAAQSTKMRLTASGNLGIGTSSPLNKLDVRAASDVIANYQTIQAFSTDSAAIDKGAGLALGGYYSGTSSIAMFGSLVGRKENSTAGNFSGYLAFGTNNNATGVTEKMRLDSSGNLGIGTSSPSTLLHLSAANPILLLQETDQAANSQRWGIQGESALFKVRAFNDAMSSAVDLLIGDRSGNLGLGITPSAWSGRALQVLDLSALSATGAGDTSSALTHGAFWDGTNWKYTTTNVGATRYQMTGANAGSTHSWSVSAGGTAGNTISFTQAMTLTAAGDLGVGTTSPTTFGAGSVLVTSAGTTTYGGFIGSTNNVTVQMWADEAASQGSMGTRTNHPIRLTTNNTERARITSGGYFKASNDGTYVGSTAAYHEFRQTADERGIYLSATNASFTSSALVIDCSRNTTDGTFTAIQYYNTGAGANKFLVYDSGNVVNTNGSYGTISDAKMKTDIVDAGSQWDDIKAVRFRKFKMKDDPAGLVQLGVVAQELEQVSPGLVSENPDRDAEGNDLGTTTKSVKTSVLLIKAAVALQEAMARIEKLEAEMAALKGV